MSATDIAALKVKVATLNASVRDSEQVADLIAKFNKLEQDMSHRDLAMATLHHENITYKERVQQLACLLDEQRQTFEHRLKTQRRIEELELKIEGLESELRVQSAASKDLVLGLRAYEAELSVLHVVKAAKCAELDGSVHHGGQASALPATDDTAAAATNTTAGAGAGHNGQGLHVDSSQAAAATAAGKGADKQWLS